MFIKSTITALFALAAQGVLAQEATTQEVNVLVANFEQADLVPALLPTFSPQGVLDVAFSGNEITTGQALAADAVASFPSITVEPVEGATEIGMGSDYVYTAMMVDADIVGTNEMTTNQTFHWLANGATIGTNNALDLTAATTAIDYVGPGPFAGTGPHRYTVLLVRQYSNFTAPTGLTFGAYSTSSYLGTTGLGPVVAANYFTVENGEATMSISSTMAVDTATVVGAASTTAGSSASSMGSASSMASMSMSMSSMASRTSGAATGVSSSAAASSTGAGVSSVKLGGNVFAAGITVVGIAMGAFML